LAEGDWRDEHPTPAEEATSLSDQIANYPALIVQKKVRNASDVAVGGAHRVPFEIF
jgi:hypothetical protein